ncbi:MAG: selenocysteine-specific translation elongation factor [Actinomycetota bacterium]
MTVIATAGHVDHGKSTLVLRLTGTDPDRWVEEKSRGLTIDLGFATTTLPSGRELSFIDVPGHIRFLRNMLSGVGAVDGCVFVVAGTEGWKPQSEEHLRILSLLGLRHGVIALTKVDQIDEELAELARMEIEEHVAGTFLEGAEVVGVSATENIGMDELRGALDQIVDRVDRSGDRGVARLWVDRSFAPAGAGTVITGTLTGGGLAVGDQLELVPGPRSVRVRGLQSHHHDLQRVEPGNRVAVNLTGVGHAEVARGDVLVTSDAWHDTAMIDAELEVLGDLGHPVSRRGAYLAYIGSGEFPARVRVLQGSEITPGERGLIRLYLDRAAPLLPGDRFILRESGRDETVGGGEILDVDPVLPASRANPDRSIERLVAERGWVTRERLTRLTGVELAPTADDGGPGEEHPAVTAVGDWVVDPAILERVQTEVREQVERAGALGLDVAALDDRQRAVLDLLDDVQVAAGRATIGEGEDPLADHPWVAELAASPFNPPGPDGVDRSEVRELVRRGTVVEEDGVHFARSSIDEAIGLLRSAFEATPDGLTVAEIRDLLGTTRKFALPLLAHLDGTGVTRRRGDVRIAGPRMPAG